MQPQVRTQMKYYTLKEKATVRRGVKQGMSATQIGTNLGRNRGSVNALIRRLGIERPADVFHAGHGKPLYSQETLEQMRKWWVELVPVAEIARRVGKTPSAIEHAAARYGWPHRKSRGEWVFDEDNLPPVTLATLAWMGGTDGRDYGREGIRI